MFVASPVLHRELMTAQVDERLRRAEAHRLAHEVASRRPQASTARSRRRHLRVRRVLLRGV